MKPVWKTIKNVLALLLSRGGDILYAFFSMAILARYFGPASYGDYVFIVSFVYIFIPIINFGISPIMVRELSIRKTLRGDYFGSGAAFRLILTGIALLAILIALPFLALNRLQQLALLICFLGELLHLGCRSISEVFLAFERMEIETYLFMANRAVSLTLLVGVSYYDLGFLAVFICFASVYLVTALAGLLIMRRQFMRPRLIWRADLLWFWFKVAWPMAISVVVMEYFLRVDIYILRIFRDSAEIAYFEAPYKLISKVNLIASAFAIAFSPAYARLAEGGLAQLKTFLEQCLKILLIIVIPLATGAVIIGPHLMVLIFGEKFAPAAPAMALLAWCLYLSFFEPFLSMVLIMIKKTGGVLVIHLAALGIDLVLDLLLVPRYGYLGACYANLIAYGTMFLVSMAMTYYAVGGFSLRAIIGRVIPLGLLLGCCLYAYKYLGSWLLISRATFITLGTVLCLALYLILLFLGGALSRKDMELLKEAMGQTK